MNNVTLTAMLVAILAAAHGVSFLVRGWHNRLFQSFAFLCLTVLVANIGFVMSSLTGTRAWFVLQYLGGIWSAPAAVYFFLRLLGKPQPRGRSLRPLLLPLCVALSIVVIVAFEPIAPISGDSPIKTLFFQWLTERLSGVPSGGQAGALQSPTAMLASLAHAVLDRPSTHLVPVVVGTYIFGSYFIIWLNVLDRRKRTRSGLERTRLTLLAWLGGLTALGTFLQAGGPYLEPWGSDYPLGGLAQIVFIAFLSQVILLYRLLDLHESVSKGLIFLAQVLIIGGVYGMLVVLFGDRKSWVNLAITIFLASGVVSLIHEPLRGRIERTIHRFFFHRRYELLVRLEMLEHEFPRILSEEDLLNTLINALTDVPRITHAAIFLWDERARDYICVRRSGPDGWPPLVKISGLTSFIQEMLHGKVPLEYEDLEREIVGVLDHREEVSAALEALGLLQSDVAVPFAGDGLLYGFVVLKDDSMHEGFTHDELELLQSLAGKASVIIQNSNAIQRMKERDRLAALGEMAAGLAHEIRNPLGAIRGAAQYIADEASEMDREFVDIIMEEADRLNKVVTEFLDYSRPLQVRIEAHNLNRLVSQAAALLGAQGLPEGVDLELELDKDLPPTPVDVEKMKQVLLNLLQNALQAMPKGGQLKIQTRRAPRRAFTGTRRGEATLDRVEIVISDSGEGMTPERMEHLFIPFYTTKPGGTGLGLAICQRLVKAHEGEIEVESVEGKGTRFTVRLPLFQSTTATPPAGGARPLLGPAS